MTEYQLYQLDEVDQVMKQIATEMLSVVKKKEKQYVKQVLVEQ